MCFLFRIFFLNITKINYLINKNILQKNINLSIKHIPNISENEKVGYFVEFYEIFLERKNNSNKLTLKDIYYMV